MGTGSELFAEILDQYGIRRVFGNPGTTELPLIDAIDDMDLEFTLGLHEDIAVGMAAGYAMKKQEIESNDIMPVSVVNLHSTPGLLHGACNIYNGSFSNAPMIITTGSQNPKHEDRSPSLSGSRQQSIKDHVKWSRRVSSADEIPHVMRRAFRKALSRPTGPVYVDIPLGVQDEEVDFDVRSIGSYESSDKTHYIDDAVNIIQNNEDVIIIVGDEVRIEGKSTIDAVVELSEKTEADVYGELLLSRTSFDFEHENWMGGIEHGGSPGSVTEGYDLVIEVGCTSNVPFTDDDFVEYDKPTIVLSHTPDSGSHRERVDVLKYGSLESICNSINKELAGTGESESLKSQTSETSVTADKTPITYEEIGNAMNLTLSEGDNFIEEGVTVGAKFRDLMSTNVNLYSNKGGGLGFGLPASIGVHLAEEDYCEEMNPTISLVGDGAFHYYPQSVYSVAEYIDSSFTILVPRNGGYEILKDENRKDKKYLTIQDETPINKIASDYGVESEFYKGLKISSKIDEHLGTEHPTLLELPVRPD